jgi:hypothetical protein
MVMKAVVSKRDGAVAELAEVPLPGRGIVGVWVLAGNEVSVVPRIANRRARGREERVIVILL